MTQIASTDVRFVQPRQNAMVGCESGLAPSQMLPSQFRRRRRKFIFAPQPEQSPTSVGIRREIRRTGHPEAPMRLRYSRGSNPRPLAPGEGHRRAHSPV